MIKLRLLTALQVNHRPKTVRIACRELETFYLADLKAVEMAFDIKGLQKQQPNKKFRNPDYLVSPNKELKSLTKQRYEKVAGSREIGKYMDVNNQRSPGFRNLVSAILRMEQEQELADSITITR